MEFISFYLTSEVFAGSDRKQSNAVLSSEETYQLRRNELFFKATFRLYRLNLLGSCICETVINESSPNTEVGFEGFYKSTVGDIYCERRKRLHLSRRVL